MKKLISNIFYGVVGVSVTVGLWGCVSENPFESDGEGTIQLRTVVNSITTRADEDETNNGASDPLRDNCVVYITSDKGLIYKEKGLDKVKTSFTLKAGSYVAEAWTGDSVSASFDKKFYRGYEPFEVTKGSSKNVVLNCQIANVVASINTSSIDPNLMKDDYEITIKNSRGELKFDKTNAATDKAYFMMPNNDTKLEYIIKGTNIDGESFTKEGTIENVKKAHNYILNFEYKPEGDQSGSLNYGAVFIKINVKEEEITDNKIETFNTRPTITSFRYNLEKQFNFVNDEDIPETLDLQICGFKGLKYINLSSTSYTDLGWPSSIVNILEDNSEVTQLKDSGVVWNIGELNTETNVITATVSFPQSLLEKLSKEATAEHVITIAVEDMDEPYEPTEVNLRFARNEGTIVIEDPIVIDKVNQNDWHNVKAHSVTVSFQLADEYEGTPGVEYRKAGSDDPWSFAAANLTANAPGKTPQKAPKKYYVTMPGLEAGCTYEYRGCCGEFHSNDVMTVTTESTFTIPYADMETWNSFTIDGTQGCRLPGVEADEFWGNGNPGSMSLGVTLTQESEDIFKSSKYSAKLRSQFVGLGGAVGKFAAGNLFAGTYVKTDGTDGVLEFGRPYNGSHPKALRVWVNYRPGTVEKNPKDAPENTIVQGGLDEGQIFVALSTAPIEIRTKKATKKLFNKDDDEILAYGQYTFEKVSYGPDGELQELIIPIDYYDKANSSTPSYLVIVCSASKYGDYFCGGEGSTMYVDDFELIYE